MEFELLFMEQESAAYDSGDLVRDLRLDTLCGAMSGGHPLIRDACSAVMVRPLTDRASIAARSEVVKDAIARADIFAELFSKPCWRGIPPDFNLMLCAACAVLWIPSLRTAESRAPKSVFIS